MKRLLCSPLAHKIEEEKFMIIREANISDTADILAIYAPYVENTAISFEYDVPDIKEFEERIRSIKEKYPYLVAEEDGKIIGYCYAKAFHPRKAYERCVELSIYIARQNRGNGIGRALYTEAEKRLREMGILNMYACVASPIEEDEYLTRDSEKFHKKMGYEQCGLLHHCGYKFGRWYNMMYLEKFIK